MPQAPRHPAARKCVHASLFVNVENFRELEKRIAELSTERDRGAAFEVFAEAYFATQPIHQVKAIWADRSAPASLVKRAGLTRGDQGSDGIIETTQGKLVSYQVKFRTNRPHLTWGEISTFMGQTDQVDHRILFTNSTSIANVAKTRTRFSKVGGDVLDRLTREDFKRIEKWLKGSAPKVRHTFKPKPHQVDAIKKITGELAKSSRTMTTMACGTGKSLTALWVAEKINPKTVLILVPSLALLRQLLRDWMEQTSWKDFSYLCVCSDESVNKGDDGIALKTSDLEFDVTTDIKEVARFMGARFSGVKLIFSTYQSADVVGRAAKKSKHGFDLGIFDEAHKTAGREGRAFAYALHDKNIRIKKRIFFTATPRHFDVLKKNKDGEATPVYSMDDVGVYGRVAYSLPFSEAAKREIICPFKAVISVITSDQVSKDLIKQGTTKVRSARVDTQQVANQLALTAAVRKHGVRKIFSFHRTVASAASFVSDGPEGIRSHLKGFKYSFVSGAMPTHERDGVITEFKDAKAGIIANARCLTEGVDVPAVDMVGFLSPRRSLVDVVQAAGRAMRRNDKAGKKVGYLLIPLYVERARGESLEDALARTKFDNVWTILQALQEQDEVLAEIIRKMREAKGEGLGFNDRDFADKVEVLGANVDLKVLRRSITLACVESLSSNWDERFGELKVFFKREGHCNVPKRGSENPRLGSWVSVQRAYKSKLSFARLARLNEIRFDWDRHNSQWEEMFNALVEFNRTEGHCRVPRGYFKSPRLASWVALQRNQKTNLSSERLKRLNEIGFDWDPHSTQWEEMFSKLEIFKKSNGHCNVPISLREPPRLGTWVSVQRLRKSDLSIDRRERLDALGFNWDPIESKWEEMFSALLAFKKKEGHCNVPQKYSKPLRLGSWVNTLRLQKSTLSRDRLKRLNALGFDWNPINSRWEEMFDALVKFKKLEGHCNVPVSYTKNSRLGRWVSIQRSRKSKLSLDQRGRLNKLGFDWSPAHSHWEEMFSALVSYKKRTGDCDVPAQYSKVKGLGAWVSNLRSTRAHLSRGQRKRLNEIGFDWDPLSSRWEEMFSDLVVFKKEHGHCNVPVNYSKNHRLSSWVTVQRAKMVKQSQERRTRLSKLGFDWDPRNTQWEKMLAALIEFRKAEGHCNVPYTYSKDQVRLGNWVSAQRIKRSKLSVDQVRRLDKLGFEWKQR